MYSPPHSGGAPYTLNPNTLNPHSKHLTPNPQPSTLNPTLHPQPSTLNRKA